MTQFNFEDKICIAGGTALSIVPTLRLEDIMLTIIMAIIGAFASFVASVLFKFLAKKLFKRD